MNHTLHPPANVEPTVIVESSGNDQLLYFTSSSLTADGQRVYFISDRDGSPNVFSRDLHTGREIRHSDNHDSALKSYVYFDGTPYRGFGKASVSLDGRTGTVYFIQGRQIIASDREGHQRIVAEYPDGQMTAFTHISADGSRLCVPTVDARALEGEERLNGRPAWDIDQRVREENLSSCLRVYDTRSGAVLLEERVPRAWITHVQFSPVDPNVILYNHEWPSDCGIRRLWLWDGRRHLRLRAEGEGRSRADWVCHEMWESDGGAIIYHGTLGEDQQPFIGRVRPDGSGRVEIILPTGSTRYGHFTPGSNSDLVTDGYYETPGDPNPQGGAWLSHLKVDWAAQAIAWRPLCRHGSSWTSQDAHPHPIIAPDGRSAWFTTDRSGRRTVCRVAL